MVKSVKDREIIEKYLKSLKEEMLMYSDSLSANSLPYIDKLKCRYNKWEKDLCKLDGTWVKKEKHKSYSIWRMAWQKPW